jgi:beta-alanine--pyruvate transaminase
LFERAGSLAPYWENAIHSLRGSRHVIDIRTIGIVAGIELEARSGAVGARGFETFVKCFEAGVLVRVTADTIALSPPLIVEEQHIDRIVDVIGRSSRGGVGGRAAFRRWGWSRSPLRARCRRRRGATPSR